MATASQVKTALNAVAQEIATQRANMFKAKGIGASASASLDGLASTYADVIATVNGYGTTNAFESVSKAELAKLTSEFQALKTIADGVAGINVG